MKCVPILNYFCSPPAITRSRLGRATHDNAIRARENANATWSTSIQRAADDRTQPIEATINGRPRNKIGAASRLYRIEPESRCINDARHIDKFRQIDRNYM